MAEADTLAYYGKLTAARAAQPVVPAVGFGVKQCNAGNLSGDAIYTYRCPAAWLEFAGAPSALGAELVFPRMYFTWVKQYLLAALSLKPSSSASAEFRVVWALDVWAHVNFALFAFPFPWSDIYSGGVGGVPELALGNAVFAAAGPKSLVGASAEVAAWSSERVAAEKTASTATIRDAIVNSRLCPSPFSELTVQWVGAPGGRSRLYQQPNSLWPLLLTAMQPWSSSWSSNWIASRNNKDAADLKRWAAEPALLRAAMQWRLWSAQDWGYSGPDPTYWPESMGRANATVALSTYINSVKSEYTAPRIAFRAGQAYPNLAFGLDAVTSYARIIAGLNYDVVLQSHFDMWLQQSSPRVAMDGSLPKNADGSFVRQPVTRVDYADYFKGLRKTVTDRMRATLANPALTCAPNDAPCLKAAGYTIKLQQAIQSSPLAPLQNSIARVADKLVTLIGGAVGGGYEPFFVLRDPFSRTFGAPGYRLVADGSTGDVFFRLALAIARYKELQPGIFTAAVPATARVSKAACQVWWTRQQAACEICDGQPRPACAADVANLPPYVPPVKALDAATAKAQCDADWQTFISGSSPYRHYVTAADRVMHDQICAALKSGTWSLIAASNAWHGYLVNKYGPEDVLAAKGGLFAALKVGFLRSSNPLR